MTLLAIGINLLVLLPLAWVAGAYPAYGPWLALIAYVVLAAVLGVAGAGRREAAAA